MFWKVHFVICLENTLNFFKEQLEGLMVYGISYDGFDNEAWVYCTTATSSTDEV